MGLQWFLRESPDTSRIQYFAGTLSPNNVIKTDLFVWHNREGQVDIEDIQHPVLLIRFNYKEDATVLDYSTISIDDQIDLNPKTYLDNGVVRIRLSAFSGKANDGDMENLENKGNYKRITLTLDPRGANIKNKDIKNVYFDIIDEDQ